MGFYGNQLVKNVSMFLTLKKFTVIFLLIIDLFFAKKKNKFNYYYLYIFNDWWLTFNWN